MDNNEKNPDGLTQEENARLVIDFIHRLMMHHTMWFSEVQQKYGQEKALEVLAKVFEQSYAIQMKRLAKTLDFELQDGIPAPLLALTEERLLMLKEKIASNWLANDGIWFQAIEFTEGMNNAKQCNDACWERFSPFEAWSIKRFLSLPEDCGLEGLKKALAFRLYAAINTQSIEDESAASVVFRMNDCRVQSARKRKGLDDYPCKSAGIIEYSAFAQAVDSRIKTECIGCPPDKHPEEWYCAWRFSI
jgi:hypothetical protein